MKLSEETLKSMDDFYLGTVKRMDALNKATVEAQKEPQEKMGKTINTFIEETRESIVDLIKSIESWRTTPVFSTSYHLICAAFEVWNPNPSFPLSMTAWNTVGILVDMVQKQSCSIPADPEAPKDMQPNDINICAPSLSELNKFLVELLASEFYINERIAKNVVMFQSIPQFLEMIKTPNPQIVHPEARPEPKAMGFEEGPDRVIVPKNLAETDENTEMIVGRCGCGCEEPCENCENKESTNVQEGPVQEGPAD